MNRQHRENLSGILESVLIISKQCEVFEGFDIKLTHQKISRDVLRMNLVFLTSYINKLLCQPDTSKVELLRVLLVVYHGLFNVLAKEDPHRLVVISQLKWTLSRAHTKLEAIGALNDYQHILGCIESFIELEPTVLSEDIRGFKIEEVD